MKKVLVVCGNGLGSSFMVEMNAKKVLKDLGIEAEVGHTDLASAKMEKADLFLGSREIVANLDDGSRRIAGLKNLMDKKELAGVLESNLKD